MQGSAGGVQEEGRWSRNGVGGLEAMQGVDGDREEGHEGRTEAKIIFREAECALAACREVILLRFGTETERKRKRKRKRKEAEIETERISLP